MIHILHITPHFGGGVGKFLSGISQYSNPNFKHTFICLESPKDRQFIDIANKYTSVVESPSIPEIETLIQSSDIVEIEYWDNPTLIETLSNISSPSRFLVVYHNNGLFVPTPISLILNSDKFIFTSECSYQNKEIQDLISTGHKEKFGYIYTSGGFRELQKINSNKEISVGYAGTYKFSKLHPDYAKFINSVDIPNFKVRMIGNSITKDILEKQSDRFIFTGFVPDIYTEFEKINVLAYLLNSKHYGTTENVLLEAMSVGIVPIVLNNPPESQIIENGINGFIIKTPKQFAKTIKFLSENPENRRNMGLNAIMSVRQKFSVKNTVNDLNKYYTEILSKQKHTIDFKSIFGVK